MNYNFIRSHRASQILKDFLISNGINHHWLIPRNICPIVLKVFNSLSINYSLIDICENGLINLNKIGNERVNYGLLYVEAYGQNVNTNILFKEFKINNPNSIIIKDKCLSIPEITINFNTDNYSDLILYSTGYSKFLDLKEGGYAFYIGKSNFKSKLDFESNKQNFINRYKNYNIKNNWNNITILDIEILTKNEQKEKEKRNSYILNILENNKIQYKLISDVWRFTILTKDLNILTKVLIDNNILFGKNYPCIKHDKIKLNSCQACSQQIDIVNIFNDFRLDIK